MADEKDADKKDDDEKNADEKVEAAPGQVQEPVEVEIAPAFLPQAGAPEAEKMLDINPQISQGLNDDLVFCEKRDKNLSDGAEKFFQRFVTHSLAKNQVNKTSVKKVEKVTIVNGCEEFC